MDVKIKSIRFPDNDSGTDWGDQELTLFSIKRLNLLKVVTPIYFHCNAISLFTIIEFKTKLWQPFLYLINRAINFFFYFFLIFLRLQNKITFCSIESRNIYFWKCRHLEKHTSKVKVNSIILSHIVAVC